MLHGGITLSRHVVFHSAALVGAGFYLVTTSIAGEALRLHSGSWGPAFEMAFLVATAVILVVVLESASVRAKTMVFIGKHFFRLKYDYRNVWLSFIRMMANTDTGAKANNDNLHLRALRAVSDIMGCEAGVLWTLQIPIEAYVPMATRNIEGDFPMITLDNDLPQFFLRTRWIIDVHQCARDPEFYGGLALPDWLTGPTKHWILVPLIHNNALEAFLLLANPRSKPNALGWEEFDLLKTVGAQTASYLAEERASRELVDARRIAEFNRRFAFVIHDIKNVVGQMVLMLQNAQRFGNDPDFQQDMLLTVGSAAERLKGMLVQLGSEPIQKRVELHEVELNHVVMNTIHRWRRSNPGIAYDVEQDNFLVSASSERLVTVLDHLIQNAVEAIPPGGEVKIVLRGEDKEALIEIIDNGPGMSPEFIRDQLFRPMETSKPTGSGIGAYQALKLIRDIGGRLEVDSTPGKGTAMRIRLKRNQSPKKITPDLQESDASLQ